MKIYASIYIMQIVLKVMPPIYIHGNHSQYKEHNNTIWQSEFLATEIWFSTYSPTISYAFAAAMNKNLHATLAKICTNKGDLL